MSPLAPEQARAVKELTPALDVFSLGGVIAFAATSEPPFGASAGTDQLFRIVHEPPDLARLRGLDPELADVVESCLAKDPADRPSAAELLQIAEGHAVAGRPQWPPLVAQQIAVRADFAAAPRPREVEEDGLTEFEESVPEKSVAEKSVSEVLSGLEVVVVRDDLAADGAAVEGGVVEGAVAADLAMGGIAEVLAPGDSAHAETVPLVSGPRVPPKRKVARSRKTLLLALAVLLFVGGTGTLVALNKVPFVGSDGKNTGSGDQTLAGGVAGRSSATSHATSSTHASNSPTPSASAKTGAAGKPTPSSSSSATAVAGTGGGNSSTTGSSGGGGGGGGGAGTTTSAAATKTTTSSGSGGGGSGGSGSGGGDATVVSTSYSEIKNVATGICVSGNIGIGAATCDGQDDTAYRELSVSGGFELVGEAEGGMCLYNDSTSGDAYAYGCTWNTALVTWTLGTRTSRGGELVNSGKCLSYSSTATGNLDLETCNSSDSNQLWYDGGS